MIDNDNQAHAQLVGSKPKALSLFTGAGGLDIGFHRMGFDIVACVEVEPIFCKTLESNRGRYFSEDCKIICADIRHLEPAELKIESVDVIVGGPPCQSFSAAGRRAGGVTGISDVRGSLFEHYCRFVTHFKPQAFIFENVRGILQGNKGRDWQEILSQFESLGYSLFYKVLDAADYGVPQHRERLILVGVNKGTFLFPRPTHGPDSLNNASYVTAYEAIRDLQPENEPIYDYGGKYGKLLQEVPPGMNYHYFTKELGYPQPIFAWRSRFSDFLYKADPDKPTKTIVARLGKYSGPFHWKSRKFTLAEFKRLQSFPNDYKFAGSLSEQLRQIGNSVAPTFADALASALKKQLFESYFPVELLPEHYHLSFDRRKSTKAKSTRRTRQSIVDELLPSLFTPEGSHTHPESNIKHSRSTQDTSIIYFLYTSSKKRIPLDESTLPEGAFRFEMKRQHEDLHMDIAKHKQHSFVLAPIIEFTLKFAYPIGDGIRQIVCLLHTDTGLDIPVAWDAIELGLRTYSNYHSLMDVYGHFTEPHPIFSLTCAVKNLQHDSVIRFAEYFSHFEHTTLVFPAQKLKQIMGEQGSFDFLSSVRSLRQLRFDVRVHETNLTIPQGMFRCCYPFTLSYDKQVSVSWKEREYGNHSLVF
ncbi:MAG: DNA cytosine methyltransferase [Ktedonobacteraceae bacterium]